MHDNKRVALPLTFSQFSSINRHRCESIEGYCHPLRIWSTSDWFMAIMGELGEAANVAKKLNRHRDGIPNKESVPELKAKLRKEMGDMFVYYDLACQSLGLDVAEIVMEVFDSKSKEIGYPTMFR
jgi:NTP pyrophosphatase (non-canonical NTP hydrolase)